MPKTTATEKTFIVKHPTAGIYMSKTPKTGMRDTLHARLLAAGYTIVAEVAKVPGEKALYNMMDGIAKATDGCRVEPDGHCQHGKPSWLLALGLM